jgi:membrane associated rhomboid family serine protease
LWAVLDAAGIPGAIEDRRGTCLLVVREEDLPRAVQELDDYRREVAQVQPARALTTLPGGWLGILAYSVALVTVAGLADRNAFGSDWFDAGRAQAGLMVQGEWWRSVTALTLHVDTEHLMGNLFFGSVLGFLVAQALGGGVAWFAILAAGTLGNAANALLQDSRHSAVGASTAVFGALGLLVALALYHRRGRAEGVVRRWSPLVAGVLLLAWTGIGGERTDVLAHVTGLTAGLFVGAACGLIPLAVLEKRSVQVATSVLAVLMLVSAWAVAHTGGT